MEKSPVVLKYSSELFKKFNWLPLHVEVKVNICIQVHKRIKTESCQPIYGIVIANKSFSSAKAALVCSFRASGKNRRHLGCRNVYAQLGVRSAKQGNLQIFKLYFTVVFFNCNFSLFYVYF